jgi:gamma-glutamyltranspeptidase/glutathione hydrolase
VKALVASGHWLTSQAAAQILQAGGNAFDAAVGAGFASTLTEPTLTSLGGGGFLLAHVHHKNEDILFDFFVDTPGKGLNVTITPHFFPVTVYFKDSTQDFHIGRGSVAVPGTLKGLLHVHKRLGSLPLEEILKPTLTYAFEGVELTSAQAYFFSLLEPIMTYSDTGKALYTQKGDSFVKKGDKIFNPLLGTFLKKLIKQGDDDFYQNYLAQQIAQDMLKQGGFVTTEDLHSYKVIERLPLQIRYRDYHVITNPPPSSGGIIIGLYLSILDKCDLSCFAPFGISHLKTIAQVMKLVDYLRFKKKIRPEKLFPLHRKTIESYADSIKAELNTSIPYATKGTTHISIIDKQGNAASMTTSNGEGSGIYVPGTGIMLNNMLGEDDLHPDGFLTFNPGIRVSSMMSPTIIKKNEQIVAVIGSGGSKRIRTSILQVIINLFDFHMPIKSAVESPRIHLDDEGVLHMEPGYAPEICKELKKHYPLNVWSEKALYFGGVHSVCSTGDGWGDSRRGGAFVKL